MWVDTRSNTRLRTAMNSMWAARTLKAACTTLKMGRRDKLLSPRPAARTNFRAAWTSSPTDSATIPARNENQSSTTTKCCLSIMHEYTSKQHYITNVVTKQPQNSPRMRTCSVSSSIHCACLCRCGCVRQTRYTACRFAA